MPRAARLRTSLPIVALLAALVAQTMPGQLPPRAQRRPLPGRVVTPEEPPPPLFVSVSVSVSDHDHDYDYVNVSTGGICRRQPGA